MIQIQDLHKTFGRQHVLRGINLEVGTGEIMVITELARRDDPTAVANVTLRGVEPASFALRPQLRLGGNRDQAARGAGTDFHANYNCCKRNS